LAYCTGAEAYGSGLLPKVAKKSAALSAVIDPRLDAKGFSVTTGWLIRLA